jgi:hypothetical protein
MGIIDKKQETAARRSLEQPGHQSSHEVGAFVKAASLSMVRCWEDSGECSQRDLVRGPTCSDPNDGVVAPLWEREKLLSQTSFADPSRARNDCPRPILSENFSQLGKFVVTPAERPLQDHVHGVYAGHLRR